MWAGLLPVLDGNAQLHELDVVPCCNLRQIGKSSSMCSLNTVQICARSDVRSLHGHVAGAGFKTVSLAAGKNAGIASFAVLTAATAAACASTGAANPLDAISSTADSAQTLLAGAVSGTQSAGTTLQNVFTATADALWPGRGGMEAVILVAWTALGPGAIASTLQTWGQASVPAAETQVRLGAARMRAAQPAACSLIKQVAFLCPLLCSIACKQRCESIHRCPVTSGMSTCLT
jgi:hypothetical protein